MLEREGEQTHARWLPNGSGLVFQEGGGSRADLWLLDMEGEAEPRLLLQTPVNEAQPDLSPDGRFIVYHSTVSGGVSQIFAQPLEGDGGRVQVSTDGGWSPRWSPTGDEIFYSSIDARAIMAVDVFTGRTERAGPNVEVGVPHLLFEWPVGPQFDRHYDVAPDGKQFVVVGQTETQQEPTPRIQFVLNWFRELERLAPRQ